MEKRQEVNQRGRKKLGNKGFSLVELIVVIAIMAILTVVIAPQFMRYIEKSRESVDLQTIDSIKSSIQAALADEKAYDATSTADVTIEFTNSGDFPSDRSITGSTIIVENPVVTVSQFDKELNLNLDKTVKFKSKEYKDGVKFTIVKGTKEIKFEKIVKPTT